MILHQFYIKKIFRGPPGASTSQQELQTYLKLLLALAESGWLWLTLADSDRFWMTFDDSGWLWRTLAVHQSPLESTRVSLPRVTCPLPRCLLLPSLWGAAVTTVTVATNTSRWRNNIARESLQLVEWTRLDLLEVITCVAWALNSPRSNKTWHICALKAYTLVLCYRVSSSWQPHSKNFSKCLLNPKRRCWSW